MSWVCPRAGGSVPISGTCGEGSRSWGRSALASERALRLDVEMALGGDVAWDRDSWQSGTRETFSSTPCPPRRWGLGPQLLGLVSEREPQG